MLMEAIKQTITKAEIAEHFVTLEEMHEHLVKNIKQRFAERELRAKKRAAMKEAREGNLKTYSSVDEMMEEIL
jgi:hypothetical protein